jgi:DNA modification methylase
MSPIESLKPHPDNPRKHSPAQLRSLGNSILKHGFNTAIVIDDSDRVLAGHGRLEAARRLGMTTVPTIRIAEMSDAKGRAYMIADNKLTDRSSWDESKLAAQLEELSLNTDLDIEDTAFEQAEADRFIQSFKLEDTDLVDEFELSSSPPVTKVGDRWTLRDHHLLCGSSLDAQSYAILLGDQKCAAVFTDPPYNVPIQGHVRGNGRLHREFPMASGEMANEEFEAFLSKSLALAAAATMDGGLIYVCMDWRGLHPLTEAARANLLMLLNLCVWVKTNGGMGSFYRSRHELIFVFRNGSKQHLNNIQLGRFGRNRTNVWNYAGANSFARGRKSNGFETHPTVKPLQLVVDALLDCTNRGDPVLDPFIGSGTTLLAAEQTGRRCFGIELDPLHVDTAVRRWEEMTGEVARNQNGLTMSELKSMSDGHE